MNVIDFHAEHFHPFQEAAKRSNQPRVHILLDDLQSPINIGKCARIAEIYGMDLYLHDPRFLVRESEALKTISDFACGAWNRRKCHLLPDMQNFARTYKAGRLVATCLHEDAVRLDEFEFADNDVIMFGNEYDGLSPELIERADAKVYISMPKLYLPKPSSHKPIDPARGREVNQNGVPNLNVAVAAGIVGYAFSCWLERNGYLPFKSEDVQCDRQIY